MKLEKVYNYDLQKKYKWLEKLRRWKKEFKIKMKNYRLY